MWISILIYLPTKLCILYVCTLNSIPLFLSCLILAFSDSWIIIEYSNRISWNLCSYISLNPLIWNKFTRCSNIYVCSVSISTILTHFVWLLRKGHFSLLPLCISITFRYRSYHTNILNLFEYQFETFENDKIQKPYNNSWTRIVYVMEVITMIHTFKHYYEYAYAMLCTYSGLSAIG